MGNNEFILFGTQKKPIPSIGLTHSIPVFLVYFTKLALKI